MTCVALATVTITTTTTTTFLRVRSASRCVHLRSLLWQRIKLKLKLNKVQNLSLAIRDHTYSVTCHPTQVNAPHLIPASKLVLDLPGGMEGWVYLDYPAMHRAGVELAISRSQVWPPNHYTTEQPMTFDLLPGRRTRPKLTRNCPIGIGCA